MIFNNKEVKAMATEIVEKEIDFKKGTVGGYSIEIEESNPESHTSFIYYENEQKRDSDFDLLSQLRFNHVTS
jgi:hypothetical protein